MPSLRRLPLLVALLAVPPAAPAAEINQHSLLTLHGEPCSVRYTPGALDRAAHLQVRLQTLAYDYSRWGTRGYDFQGYVLSPEDWASAGLAKPYGLPERAGPRALAAPAWGDEHSVALWKRLLGGPLPWTAEGMPVRGTAEEAASLQLADVVLQTETARIFVEEENLRGAEPWIAELTAHAVALQAFASHEEVRLLEIQQVYDDLSAAGLPSLAVCPSASKVDATALACGAKFHAGARVLLAKSGLKTVRVLTKLAKKHGLSQATLLKEYPALAEWVSGGAS